MKGIEKVALVIHGGAGPDSEFIQKHKAEIKQNLRGYAEKLYGMLKRGKAVIDVVEEGAVMIEDDPLFNSGRGSCINSDGQVEMDASIVDGKQLQVGGGDGALREKSYPACARGDG